MYVAVIHHQHTTWLPVLRSSVTTVSMNPDGVKGERR